MRVRNDIDRSRLHDRLIRLFPLLFRCSPSYPVFLYASPSHRAYLDNPPPPPFPFPLSPCPLSLHPAIESIEKVSYIDNESEFRWALLQDQMAFDKLHEGIKKFAEDGETLKALLRQKLAA